MDTLYTPQYIAQAKLMFSQINAKNHEIGNAFFEMYGIGNVIGIKDRPYERFMEYENLLSELRKTDFEKYQDIHKGTPFYFLGWLAFQLKNYEKAVFYMDAALAEDKRVDKTKGWLSHPSGQFMMLDQEGNQIAKEITRHLSNRVGHEIDRFNAVSTISQSGKLSMVNFKEKFVAKLILETDKHSIVTAFYSFILEYEEREQELFLRSRDGASIEPVLAFLFKGGLIFESLLKYFYPKKDDKKTTYKTIGNVFDTEDFRRDFPKGLSISADSIAAIIDPVGLDHSWQIAFSTTSKLRNTAGHNLVWDYTFDNPDNLKKLYEQQVNAIFYLIQKNLS